MEEERLLGLIEDALASGAEAAEIYRIERDSSLVDIQEGKLDTLSRGRQEGIALRVLERQRMGFAFSSDLRREALSGLLDRALTVARQSHPDPYLHIPRPPASAYPKVEAYDPDLRRISLADRAEFARKMEQAAKEFDPRISKVRHSLYQDSDYSVLIVNSRGLRAWAKATRCSISILAVAEEKGSSETGWDMQSSSFFSDLQEKEVGRRAAQQAIWMLGARTLPTQQVDAIFTPPVAAEFWEVLSAALMADSVQKGKSLFANQMGAQVGSACLCLVDDGLLAHGSHTFPFDDEGTPSQRTSLLEKGILKGFLYDSYSAAKEGKSSTGNAGRSSFHSTPHLMATNLYPIPGKRPLEAMVQDLERGVMILSLMGMHTANPISGDFSVGAEGLWIEGGRAQHPFRGVLIAGNLRDWLHSLEEVGSDLRFFGSYGSPSLLAKGIQLAGP
ncbi:MAG: TldD/PmbA family protein [candidate division NC10 bacterium]|nr:TldD/PmbA family protein [candidate division NC10 bacterium]